MKCNTKNDGRWPFDVGLVVAAVMYSFLFVQGCNPIWLVRFSAGGFAFVGLILVGNNDFADSSKYWLKNWYTKYDIVGMYFAGVVITAIGIGILYAIIAKSL